jgi:hypothetical protein
MRLWFPIHANFRPSIPREVRKATYSSQFMNRLAGDKDAQKTIYPTVGRGAR